MAINIKLTEQSYGGKKFRPAPKCYLEKGSNLLICITAWGSEEIADEIVDSIKNFLTMANEDNEITVPYARKQNLNQKGNVLRMAIIMASERIFKEYNNDEYNAGFEIFAAIQEGPQWTYVSCGQPSFMINRKNMGTLPINHSLDLNLLVPKSSVIDPLPNQMLGLGQHPPIQYGNIRLKKSDKLLLSSRIYMPDTFYSLDRGSFDIQSITKTLATDNVDIPFWLGFIDIN